MRDTCCLLFSALQPAVRADFCQSEYFGSTPLWEGKENQPFGESKHFD